jgi:hypothetical protein
MSEVDHAAERGRAFWIGLILGIAIMLFGIAGALVNAGATHPVQFVTWLVGSDLLHDAVVAPAACAIGWLVLVTMPASLRAPVRAGLIATAVLVGVAWAPLHGYGRLPDNPSLAPLDYGTALLTTVGAVWVACAIWGAISLAQRSRERRRVLRADAAADS